MSLKKLLFLGSISFHCFTSCVMQTITVMLDPAGDAKHAGRIIEDSFERGITLQFVEKLKRYIELRDETIRVIVTRFPGESLEPLQNAQFANRLNVDLYISFHFYYEQEIKPAIFVYYFINSASDNWIQNRYEQLCFEPYDKVHVRNVSTTKKYAECILNVLKKNRYEQLFESKGVFGIPFKPLMGVTGPALGIEMGLKKKDQWAAYLEPMFESVVSVVNVIRCYEK